MRRGAPLPPEIEHRLSTLGVVLAGQVAVRFAYLFGGAGRRDLRPLSDVDVAVYLDDAADPAETRLDLIGVVTKHLGTDEVDLVVLNQAPTALLGRLVQSRRVIVDKGPFLRHRFESLALRQFLGFRSTVRTGRRSASSSEPFRWRSKRVSTSRATSSRTAASGLRRRTRRRSRFSCRQA